jgi:hypothetical protein
MLVMYLYLRVINFVLVFVFEGYRCWSCICVIGVSILDMHLCVRGIDVGHVFVCYFIDVGHVFVCVGYRCWSCICVIGVSILVMYLCVRGIDVGHVSVC